ncbi:uncharacterized protein [Amphiura filiformis]|uniref:uncharacterized protein isoform X2 n=1 Tax=Amphiura filiformis TaxID=82378 RepID=UPI003B225368
MHRICMSELGNGKTIMDQSLLCLPAEASGLCMQRCLMKPDLHTTLGLTIGQWIAVKLNRNTHCICSMWPCGDLPDRCIQIDQSVTIQQRRSQDRVPYNIETDHINVNYLENIDKVRVLDSVNVTVLFDSGEIVQEKNKSILEKYIHQLIVGVGVVKGCKVTWPRRNRTNGFPKISSILIEDVSVKDGSTTKQSDNTELKSSCIKHVGLITPRTAVTIVQLATEDVAQNLTHGTRTKIAGLEEAVTLLKKLITYPTEFPNSLEALNLDQCKGILIHGPTGVGKSSLVNYVALECNAFLVQISGPDVFGSSPGESESNLRSAFEKAKMIARSGHRCVVIFLDELDVLCPKRGVSGGTHESRIVAQLLLLMDEVRDCRRMVVVGATNRPNVIDPALRRPGRFDQEVIIGMPNTQQRQCILQVHTDSLATNSDVDLNHLAKLTNGYSGADLACLCREAAFIALAGIQDQEGDGQHHQKLELHISDFHSALSRILPSLQRTASCITELEAVPWESIGGLEEIKKKLIQAVQWPLDHWQSFARLGIEGPRGVLMYGPPGCCKTTLARAAASSGNVAFLSVNCAQLYSPFVGDSEKIIADLFQRARMSAPTVIFLDELDSIIGGRSSDKQRSLSERILSALLNEMDGIGTSPGERMQQSVGSEFAPNPKVLVLAATNRVELVDAALLRPGRFDHLIYVPPPDAQGRLDILQVHTSKIPLGEDVSLESITSETEHYTGADLEAVCREAALLALHEDGLDAISVHHRHFVGALQMCKPSLNEHLLARYKKS